MAQFGKEKEKDMEEDDWWEDKASDYRLFKGKKKYIFFHRFFQNSIPTLKFKFQNI